MFRFWPTLLTLLNAAVFCFATAGNAEDLGRVFDERIQPLIRVHCLQCHDAETREAELDLSRFQDLKQVSASHRIWEIVLDRVAAGEMPPPDAEPSLDDADREDLLGWIRDVRQREAARQAGDPGPVPVRRLSNAEYDYSIRDLTGVDLQPTKTFPIDPANEAGFDNSGESLTMSPALMAKYLEAARFVAEHIVYTPEGLRFAPHPVMTDTDRDKYCVKRIVAFYQRQPTDYADYFFAAWRYKDHALRDEDGVTLEQIAAEELISSKYLQTVWDALNVGPVSHGPLAELQRMWNELPSDAGAAAVREQCLQMRDYVVRVRKLFEPTFENLAIEGVHKGSQSFVLWKNRQYAAHRRSADFASFAERVEDEPTISMPADGERSDFEAACRRFCSVFPDAFYISERGRDYLGKPRAEQEKGRLLSAGFHSMMGYFRDDAPLYELILDRKGQRRLDALWKELDFFTSAPQRQYQGFLWFERTDSRFMRDPEFDFARPEDKAALSEPMIERLAEVYLAKAKANGGQGVPLQAIRDYFAGINRQIRWVEQARKEAVPHHLEAVMDLADRAFRRPLTPTEQRDLRDFYQILRDEGELSHEEAIQDVVASILVSPRFCYRLDLLSDSDAPRPLDNYELASRLSYFLWSSIPDEELLARAAAGDLQQPDVLITQARRMLEDDRARALALEFGGNWLDFRHFEDHNSVDRERFPSFNDALRQAMFEEPVRFILDVIQHDRSVLDLLYADRTFVNQVLAEHYEIEGLALEPGEWREVNNASAHGRGGVLPMAVFLTKNAPGLRTSPVKRGYWVVRRLLGERIPPPPPNVPELPADEAALGELTLAETLARHRAHASCAGCHNRFDSIGLVFEGYGPIGERRRVDLGGRPVETGADFPDGSRRSGIGELRSYLQEQREEEFVDNFCRKLLSYALGRTVLLSDEPLLQQMQQQLDEDEYRFTVAIETIVSSPQFQMKRGRQNAAP